VVNLDPSFAQETTVYWDLAVLGLTAESFGVTDLMDGKSYQWARETYIRLDPTRLSGKVIHIAKVKL
jgi:starch synthase (maltosyl-transferring)